MTLCTFILCVGFRPWFNFSVQWNPLHLLLGLLQRDSNRFVALLLSVKQSSRLEFIEELPTITSADSVGTELQQWLSAVLEPTFQTLGC